MRSLRRGAVSALPVVLLVALNYFTGDGRRFNDRVVEIAEEWIYDFEPPMEILEHYASGEKVDVVELRNSLDEAIALLDDANAELAALTIPDDDSCREFHAAYTEYSNLWKSGSNSFKAAVDFIETHNPPQPDNAGYVAALLDDFWAEEDRLFAQASRLQENMALRYRYRLEDEPR